MSLLWIQTVAVTMTSSVEQFPLSRLRSLTEPFRGAWTPDHPAMTALMSKIREDGGYNPRAHGRLDFNTEDHLGSGDPSNLRLAREEHNRPEFGDHTAHALALALEHLGHERVWGVVHHPVAPETPEKDPTKGRVFYHGTTTDQDLKEILPASQHGRGSIHPGSVDPDYAYATPHLDNAWQWADKAWDNRGGHRRVFKVRRKGPVELDPRDNDSGGSRNNYEGDVRSRHGFDVIGEMPMPEHWRHLEDQDRDD